MNKVFKIIWNKTTQSFVVTSELAKGAVKASSNSEQRVTSETRLSSLFKLSAFALSLSAVMMPAQANVIVGDGSNAPTNVHPFSIAVGNSATSASGGSTTAIGYGVNGRYDNSVLIGDGTGNYGGTTGSRNILIGQNAQVGDSTSVVRVNQSIAIGAGIRADKAATFGGNSITEGAWARGDQSIAIGGNVISYGNASVAIGGDDTDSAAATQTTYINTNGQDKTGTVQQAFRDLTGGELQSPRWMNTIAGEAAVSLGTKTKSGDLSLALGSLAAAQKTNAVAVGTGANASFANSVAIGGGSATDKAGVAYTTRTILGTTYTWAGGANTIAGDVVSIGKKGYERQLINLSPGDISANSTDAINGSQLYAAMAEIEKIRYFSVKSDVAGNRDNTGASGVDSIAIGPNASTASTSARSIVVGNDAFSSHADSVSLGNGAQTKNNNSTAIGTLAKTEGANSIAVGLNASTTYADSIAMGSNATAAENKLVSIGPDAKSTARYGVSLGYKASSNGSASIAIGNSTNASHDNAIAIGDAANTNSWATIAIGNNASAAASRTIAVGRNASAAGETAIAMGIDSNASQYSAIAIGELATSAGGYSVAMGHKANVEGSLSVGIGVSSNASANWTTAIGSYANASADYATALGTNSAASGGFSIASGYASKASGGNSIALGTNSNASNETTIAIGVNSLASGINTMALGQGSKATDYSAMAFGLGANSSGRYSIAIGQGTKAAIEHSIAMGYSANAEEAFAISQGAYSEATQRAAIALGYTAKAIDRDAMALGSFANASANSAVALGPHAKSTAYKSIALGADSEAGTNMFDANSTSAVFKNDAGSNSEVRFAASSSSIGGAVSVGKAGNERQIHNVAAGRISATSTDAVNGSQLYTVLNNSGFNVQENGNAKSRINNNDVVNFKDGNLTTANVTDTENGTIVKFDVNTTNITTNTTTGNATATNPNNIATAGDVTSAINNVRNMPITFTGNTGSAVKKLGESLGIVGDGTDITSTADANNVTFTLNKSTVVTAGDNKAVTSGAVDTTIKAINLTTAGNAGTGAVNLATQSLNITGSNGLITVAKDNGIEVKIDDATRKKIDDASSAKEVSASVSGSSAVSVTPNGTTKNADGVEVTDYAVDLSQATKDDIQKGIDAHTIVTNKGLTFTGTTGTTTAKKLGESVEISGDDNITTEATDDKVQIKLNKNITVDSVT
ncbi:MAG: ESPR-type extended signal peptide-containing protein, partial [Haemophilus parainfluenzae]|nr:ESPR-type extended signal peptide-containing protein [Haemophilus parainfluenzae]